MLEVKALEVSYGAVKALKGLSLAVHKGEIVSLLGSNGAGKTTTLMAISGIVRASAGEILFKGRSIMGEKPHKILQEGITHCPEGRRIFPRLTVMENLEMGAFRRGDKQKNLELVWSLFPILYERASQLGGTLSGGEQQMLAFARALMSSPELLMLDEPSLGIAPIAAERIFELIRAVNRQGITILLVEQNAHAALDLSDRSYVMENGQIRLSGSAGQLLDNEEVRKAYLGEIE